MLLAYFGHHKCACTWISDIMLNIGNDLGLKTCLTQLNVDETISEKVHSGKIELLLSLTSPYQKAKGLSPFKAFHVIRDPRDICVSGYFSHMYSHSTEGWPGLESHRQKLKSLNKTDGLMVEIDFTSYFLEHISEWRYDDPNILEIKMEDLTRSPFDEFLRVLKFLGLYSVDKSPTSPVYGSYALYNRVINRIGLTAYFIKQSNVSEKRLKRILHKNRFKKLAAGRRHGEEDNQSHYRKGVAGDWKNHFESVHKDYFKEKFGDLLIRLGYEKDHQW